MVKQAARQAGTQGQTAQINVRIDRQLKEAGDATLAQLDLSPTAVVRDLWTKLAQGGAAADAVLAALGAQEPVADDRTIIDAKLSLVDRATRRRDELAANLGLSGNDMPVYADGYDWRERVRTERDRKATRRAAQ